MRNAKPASRSTRRTIGWVTSNLMFSDGAQLLEGISAVARRHDLNLLCFPGGTLHNDVTPFYQLREFISSETLDGLILWGAMISASESDAEKQQALYESYRNLPLVVVSALARGFPSLMGGDNYQGMRRIVEHLVQVHGCRRIAFLRGIAGNQEAEERYRAYTDVLAESGLPLDPALVAFGQFNRAESGRALAALLDEHRPQLDAVIGADDFSALGALDVLHERGLRAPEDVRLAGFDDVEESRFSNPPLTTIRQPFYKMGQRAMEMMLALLAGQPVPEKEVMPLELIVRQSCGCRTHNPVSTEGLAAETSAPFRLDFPNQRERLRAELIAIIGPLGEDLEPEWADQFLDAFYSDVVGQTSRAFLDRWEAAITRLAITDGEVNVWHEVLSALWRGTVAYRPDAEAYGRAERLWAPGRKIIGEIAQRVQADRRFRIQDQALRLSEFSQVLRDVFEIEALAEVLAHELPRLGIPSAYLSVYERAEQPEQNARLILGYDEQGRLELSPEGYRFPARQFVPREWLRVERRRTLIVQILLFQHQTIGFIVFERVPQESAIYEVISGQINSALKGARLVTELRRSADELEHSHNALATAYRRLKENQEKLIFSEKMASLGRLTAGFAHEMNTPLAAMRSALLELEQLAEEYERSLGDAQIMPDDHHAIAQEMRQVIRLAAASAEQAASFVRGIKSQTREQAPHDRRRFDAVLVTREALLLLGHLLRRENCTVNFQPAETVIELSGSPARLTQVVTNLVTNAIAAMAGRAPEPIQLRLRQDSSDVLLQVIDAGVGIPPENLDKVFEPMFSTKPFGEGIGLGLALVQEIVTSDFGGTIKVDSQVGVGTTFTVLLPLNSQSV